jgi:ATP-binding cassette subfamily C protein
VVVLDAEAGSDGTLDRAVAAVVAGRTALVVAHRLAHAEQADLVVVMEDGRIVESGRHAELVQDGGPFARLWEVWHRDRQEVAVGGRRDGSEGRCPPAPSGG